MAQAAPPGGVYASFTSLPNARGRRLFAITKVRENRWADVLERLRETE